MRVSHTARPPEYSAKPSSSARFCRDGPVHDHQTFLVHRRRAVSRPQTPPTLAEHRGIRSSERHASRHQRWRNGLPWVDAPTAVAALPEVVEDWGRLYGNIVGLTTQDPSVLDSSAFAPSSSTVTFVLDGMPIIVRKRSSPFQEGALRTVGTVVAGSRRSQR